MKDRKDNTEKPADDGVQDPPAKPGMSRRDLIRASSMAAGGIAAAAGVGSVAAAAALGGAVDMGTATDERRHRCRTAVLPEYYPRGHFAPDVDLTGKFAVITGASRGIGRATAEELVARGVTVIGTSRDVANVPNPPASFDLLDLDVTSDDSVNAFMAALLAHPSYPGQVDILINNAGRYVVGTIVPPPIAPDPTGYFLEQANLGMETNYGGHVRVTSKMLLHMAPVGYSRLLFTVSSVSYQVGGSPAEAAVGDGFTNFQNVYTSSKRALLSYANSLRGFLRASGSNIQVSTVNPYSINTPLAEGLNPIFTEPVDASGNSPNPFLQGFLDAVRPALQVAPPASVVGEAYAQLLGMSEPKPNVVVGSPREPFVTTGGVGLANAIYEAENEESAVRFGCRR